MGFFGGRSFESDAGLIRYSQSNRSRYGDYRLNISVEANLPYELQFTEEASMAHLAKGFHLVEEIQTGDANFDSKVYIYSDQPETKTLLSYDSVRSAILALIESGFKIRISPHEIEISIARSGVKQKENSDEDLARTYARQLKNLKEELTLHSTPLLHDDERAYFWRWRCLLVFWVIATAFGFFTFSGFSQARNSLLQSESIVYLCFIAFGLFCAAFYANFKILRKRSRTMMHLLSLAPWTGGAILFFLLGEIPQWNQDLDQAMPRTVKAVVDQKVSINSKGSTHYQIVYYYQVPGDRYYRDDVSYGQYMGAHEGDKKQFEIHPGFFHLEWVGIH